MTLNNTLNVAINIAIETANENLTEILGLDQHEYKYMTYCIEQELNASGFETVGDEIEFLAGTAIGVCEAGACMVDIVPGLKKECDDALNGIIDVTGDLLHIHTDLTYEIAKTATDGDLDMTCLRCRMMGVVHGVMVFRVWMEGEIDD